MAKITDTIQVNNRIKIEFHAADYICYADIIILADNENRFIGRLSFILSPTANCQVATLANAQDLEFCTAKEVRLIIDELRKIGFWKNIILMDIRREYTTVLVERMEPLCKKMLKKIYISSNKSKMTLLMCYLDINKIVQYGL